MFEIRRPIPVSEAVRKVMEHKMEGQKEYVPIYESYGRFLAEDIIATNDVPHFNKSPYDGFAVRSIDTKEASLNNPIEFEVIDHIGAGYVTKKSVGPFQAVRIMTGAQMPKECNAVIMLEFAYEFERNGKKWVSIKRSLKPGENVSVKGEEIKKGDFIVPKGTKINPGVQAVLATFGYAKVPVAAKPKVGLLTTGSELLSVDEPLREGKIRDSNAYMTMAQIERAGAQAHYFGKFPDNFEACYEKVQSLKNSMDIVITTGGVSVGDFDYMPAIYEKMGATVLFNKVGMRPGSVTTVAVCDGKLLFGLSGNPSACYVGFELFVRPIIRHMLFTKKPHLRKEKATLIEDFPKANPFTRLVRSTVSVSDGKLVVSPSGRDKSSVVVSLAGANVLMVLPGGTRGFSKGDEVDVLLLEDQEGSEWPW